MKMAGWLLLGGGLVVLGLLGCGSGSGGPVIEYFGAERGALGRGGTTTLTATFANGTGVIDHGVGGVRSGVSVSTGAIAANTVFTLTVSNGLGGFTTATTAITVDPGPPAPVITLSTPAAEAGATGLTASVPARSGDGYAWTIQGGTITAGLGTAQITYSAGAAGTLALTCTETDSDLVPSAPGTASEPVLNPGAAPVITLSTTVAEAGATGLTASVPALTGDGYAWTITGGTITAGTGTSQITYTAVTAGTLTVTCTETGSDQIPSAPGIASEPVQDPGPAPVITLSAAIAEAGATGLTASVPALAGDSYAWAIQGGTITAGTGTPQITYTAGTAGTLTVTCTETDAAQIPSAQGAKSETIVTPAAVPVITLAGPITANQVAADAAGLTAQVPAQPGCTFLWTITGGTLANNTTSQVSFAAGAPGDLVLSCTATDAVGGQAASVPVTLAVLPAAPALQALPTAIVGTTGLSAAVVGPQAGLSYAWQISGGTFTGNTPGAGSSVTFTATAAGPLTLKCAAANPEGNPGPAASQTITVYSGMQFHTATPLPNGLTLIAGGEEFDDGNGLGLANAMLYDPLQQTLTATGELNLARGRHTATLLANGKGLIAGGETAQAANPGFAVTATAELYDPAAGTFSPTTGAMTTPREYHTATLLPGGQALITGGTKTGSDCLASAEWYDPASNTFTAVTSMNSPRRYHTATLLPTTGQVLVAGGDSSGVAETAPLGSAEFFNPLSVPPAFTTLATEMAYTRESHSACLEPDGTVLMSDGYGRALPFGVDELLGSHEYFDPVHGIFNEVDEMVLPTPRRDHTATLMATGDVFLFGGLEGAGPMADPVLYSNDLYQSHGNASVCSAPAMFGHTASLLHSGTVLLAGGLSAAGNPGAGPSPVVAAWQVSATDGFPVVIYVPAVLTLPLNQAASVLPVASESGLTISGASWAISPALPAGLTLDAATGEISGTPTGAASSGHYTVTYTFSYADGVTPAPTNTSICDLWITVS